MHAAQRSLFPVHGDAGLSHNRVDAVRFELLPTKAAGKEASFVLAPFQLDDEGAFEPGLGKDH